MFALNLTVLAILVCKIVQGYDKDASNYVEDDFISSINNTISPQKFQFPIEEPSVIPVSYRLEIKINDMQSSDFQGLVNVTIKAIKTIDEIAVDAKNLEIQQLESTIKIRSWYNDQSAEKIFIKFKEQFEANSKMLLTIRFTGKVRDDRSGLFRSPYTVNNTSKYALITQMEAEHAKEVVPCFDEPRFKAHWSLSIVHPNTTIALSNQPKVLSDKEGDLIRTIFPTSPYMSSYLLAFAVAEYRQTTMVKTQSGTEVRVWAPAEDVADCEMAVSAAAHILYFFENLFKIPYPLEKLDIVMVDKEFGGAMENWGMITQSKPLLVFNPKVRGLKTLKVIVEFLAHEIAHQWFGNLVTTKTWDHLWLNEGFASYFENIGLNSVLPPYHQLKDLNYYDQTFEQDRKSDVRGVVHHFSGGKESYPFSAVTYHKGSLIVGMFRSLVGDKNFYTSIRRYLKKWQNKSVETVNFLDEFDRKVREIMEPWIFQPSHPIIEVSHFNSTHIKLHQRPAAENVDQELMWTIPLWIHYVNSDRKELSFMTGKDHYIQTEELIVINSNLTGFYEVQYDQQLTLAIENQLISNHKAFTPNERMVLLHSVAFNENQESLSNYLVNETNPTILNYLISYERIKSNPPNEFERNILNGLDKISLKDIETNYNNRSLFSRNEMHLEWYLSFCSLKMDSSPCKEELRALALERVVPCIYGVNLANV